MKFKSNIEVQAGIEDKDGQVGSNGQILASTGSQVDWIDPANIVTSATDVIIECKNTSGVTIAKGTPVYQTGNVGATAVIEIAVADASDEDKMAAIGLLQSDLINNAFGYVVVTGELLNITTSPIDGSTPAVGDTIYVKPGGGLTLTKPTGVNFIQNVGLVGKVSGGNAGSITVSSIMRSNDVPTPLYIDHDNQRLGIGTDSPASPLHLSMTDGDIRMQSETSRNHILSRNSDDDSWRNLAISATSGQKQLVLNTAGNVGVGTNSPGAKLEVRNNDDSQTDTLLYIAQNPVTTEASVRTAWLRGESSAEAVRIDNYGSGHALIVGEGNVGIGTTSPTAKLHITKDNTTGNALLITNSGSSRSLEINHNADGAGVSDEVVRIMNNGTRLFTIESDGNVGIGTASPGQKLTVNGDVGVTTSNQLFVNDIAAYAGDMIIGPIGASELKFRTAGSERMLIDSSGNVGIGTTSPIVNLEIRGTVNTDDCKIYLTENNTYGAYFKYDGDLNRGYIGGITSTTTENAVLSWGRDGSELKLVTSGSTAVTIDSNRDVTFAEDIIIKEALLSNQKNTDVSGLELVANVLIASYTAAFFDFVIKKGTNVRSGTVYACHDGTNVEFTETSTNDLGDTSDVVLSVDISGTGMRLLADAATSGWSVKSLIRAI